MDYIKREHTFYSLYSYEERLHIEEVADSLGADFFGSHFERKWQSEYWIDENNRAFLNHLREFEDSIDKIVKILFQQLEDYKERTPIEPRFGLVEDTVVVMKRWLNHTIFICKKAQLEFKDAPYTVVYEEAVKWCDWRIQQITTRHGLDLVKQHVEKNEPQKPMSQARICLIRIYNEQPISKNNASAVAAQYGLTRPNAGRSLLKKYDELDNKEHRLLGRKIQADIESVIEQLSGEALTRAQNELNRVKNKRR